MPIRGTRGVIDVRLLRIGAILLTPLSVLNLRIIAQGSRDRRWRCPGVRRRPVADGRRHDSEAVNAQRDVDVRVAPTLDTWAIRRRGRGLGRRATPPPVHDDFELVLRVQGLPEGDHELGPSERPLVRDDAEPGRVSEGFVMLLATAVLHAYKP